jgi:hypothetical protein
VSWRFLAGIDEDGLGEGWSDLALAYPVYRRVLGSAWLELDPAGSGPLVVQVHAGQLEYGLPPPTLLIRAAGRCERVVVGAGWNTYHVSLPEERGAHRIELEILAPSGWNGDLMVNEVSLLPEHSSLLARCARRLNLTSVQMPRVLPSLPAPGEDLGPAPWYLPTRGEERVRVGARVQGTGAVRLLVEGEVLAEVTLAGAWRWVAGEMSEAPGIVRVSVVGEDVEVSTVRAEPVQAGSADVPQKAREEL